MGHRDATLVARSEWFLGQVPKVTIYRVRELARANLIRDPRYTWRPVTKELAAKNNETLKELIAGGLLFPRIATPGWDDDFNREIINGGGVSKTPAHYGYSWLLWMQEQAQKWVFFTGPTGMGKSHLASILGCSYYLKTGQATRFVNWTSFLSQIQRRIGREKRGMSIDDILELAHPVELANMALLILDDLVFDRRSTTPWAWSILWEILNERIAKPTIITSNSSLRQIYATLREEAQKAEPKIAQDIVKIVDRLQKGAGGNVAADVTFEPQRGEASYRERSTNTAA